MIGKQTKGRSFRGALNYLLGKDRAEIIGGNMISESPRGLAAEFGEVRKLRPNLERVVYHASLSLPPGESLSNDRWSDVADRYAKDMGFGGSQYIVVRHHDTEHSHVHILASRVRLDGTVVSESQDYHRSENTIRGIERDFGLMRVAPSRDTQSRAPTSGELRQSLRDGRASTRLQLQRQVEGAMRGRPTASQFLSRLEAQGVNVIPHIAKTGHISGISFQLGGEQMKGSDLGRGFSWKGLQQRGMQYDYDRDFQKLAHASRWSRNDGVRTTEREVTGDQLANRRGFGETARTPGAEYGRTYRGGGRSNDANGNGREQFERTHARNDRYPPHERRSRQCGNEGTHAQTLGHNDHRESFELGGSGERILRMAADVLGRKDRGREVAHVRESGISKTRPSHPRSDSKDLEVIKTVLKPMDEKREIENEREQREHLEELRKSLRSKSKSHDRGHEIDFSIDL